MKTTALIVALLAGALFAQNSPLANGVYAVEEGNAKGKNLVIRQYQGRNVAVDSAQFAPLVVEGTPRVLRDERGSSLMVQLAPEAANRLEDLTRSHLNQRIAVVVNDKILCAPIVRGVITGGEARLTPCEDASCETLLRHLGK